MDLKTAIELVDDLLQELEHSGNMDVMELRSLIDEVVDAFRESVEEDEDEEP